MSNWSSTQLTDLGRALDAKVTAGTTLLSFTKMKLGSGTETAEDIPAMTDLVSPKLVLGISSCAVSASDDTICELISVASSSDVEDSFVVREFGVFATDPDVGEILYAVMLDSTPDTMPNENVSSPVTVTYQVNIVSDNASSITAVIDPAGLVNVATLDAAIREHDVDKDAHFGLLRIRKNSTRYEVGDIAFSASLPSNLGLVCTTAGTTASSEPSFAGATDGGTKTDGTVVWTYRDILSDLSPYAKLASPALTGTPTAPTASAGTNTTQIATTAFVQTATKAVGTYNHRDERTTSGTYTAPVTGWYKITVKGGGGGGKGGAYKSAAGYGGSGGGEGGTTIGYKYMTSGTSVAVTIGAGGTGGTKGGTPTNGADGGNSTVTVNGNTYTGGGGGGGGLYSGVGGTGTIIGDSGGSGNAYAGQISGGNGGGNGGGVTTGSTGTSTDMSLLHGRSGGGGAGGVGGLSSGNATNGGNGGNGYVWFEYYSAS